MPKLTGKQILGMLLRAGGQGLGAYYDQRQLEEQEKLRAEDRDWMNTVRGWRTEDRQHGIAQAKEEQRVKQRAQTMLKFLRKNTAIPNAYTMMQGASDVLGKTASPTISAGALKEDLIRGGAPEPVAELARLKKLGIAPKAPKAPTERQRWAGLSLKPNRTPLEELEYQSLDKTYGNDKKAQKEVEKQRIKLKGDQVKWDKDVRQYVTSSFNRENFPRMIELLDKGGVLLIGSNQTPKSWQKGDEKKKWFEYLMELNRVRNVFGVRPGFVGGTAIAPPPPKAPTQKEPVVETPAELLEFFE